MKKNNIKNKVKSSKDFSIDSIKELERRINTIKNQHEDHEIAIRKIENETKIIEIINKDYDYKILLVETKGKIINESLLIIKNVLQELKDF
jgi:hypothetical protein